MFENKKTDKRRNMVKKHLTNPSFVAAHNKKYTYSLHHSNIILIYTSKLTTPTMTAQLFFELPRISIDKEPPG